MKKPLRSARLRLIVLLLVSACFASAGFVSSLPAVSAYSKTERAVYICSSPKAYAYHKSKSCRGLNRCSYEIKEIAKSEATGKFKRSACKVCF